MIDVPDDGRGVSAGSASSGRRGYGKTPGAALRCRQSVVAEAEKDTARVRNPAGGIRKELAGVASCSNLVSDAERRGVRDGGNPGVPARCEAQSRH